MGCSGSRERAVRIPLQVPENVELGKFEVTNLKDRSPDKWQFAAFRAPEGAPTFATIVMEFAHDASDGKRGVRVPPGKVGGQMIQVNLTNGTSVELMVPYGCGELSCGSLLFDLCIGSQPRASLICPTKISSMWIDSLPSPRPRHALPLPAACRDKTSGLRRCAADASRARADVGAFAARAENSSAEKTGLPAGRQRGHAARG